MSNSPVYEGKAKRLWATENPHQLKLEFKDEATAFDGVKKANFAQKGELNAAISLLLYGLLEQQGVETHLIEELDSTHHLVEKVRILPVEVIVRNCAAGSFSKRYGVEEGRKLAFSTVEFSLKSDELGDPLLNEDHAVVLELASREELEILREKALKINQVMQEFFAQCGLMLVDFKLEFGRRTRDEQLVLADEISPDSCRLWDQKTGEKMDKDRFRRDLGGVMEAYAEVLERIRQQQS